MNISSSKGPISSSSELETTSESSDLTVPAISENFETRTTESRILPQACLGHLDFIEAVKSETTGQKKMKAQWVSRPTEVPPAPEGIPPLIWKILVSRGYASKDSVKEVLTPSLKNIRDPFVLEGMDKAVARILKAHEKDESICIYADYDLDGTSALALLKSGFEILGIKNISHYQPSRLKEGYGLHNSAIEQIAKSGVSLILTVDLGITAIDEVEFAKSVNVDVIITDHHLPKDRLPEAIALVNPNKGTCGSGLGHLCGTGVAFYLLLALRRCLQECGELKVDFDPKKLLDFFVIGTLTDMVPMIEENRVLAKHGLIALEKTDRPGLRALLNALGLSGRPLTSQDVAIRFAPKLNALSRMEMGIQPIDLYLAESRTQAEELVERVLANNQNRQASQKSAQTEANEILQNSPPRGVVWVWSRNFHRGVLGLVATTLTQDYSLPAFVGACTEAGLIVGSARVPAGSTINVLEAMESVGPLLHQFGGHAAAAGFELPVENAEAFGVALEKHFSEFLLQQRQPQRIYDCVAQISELSPQFMTWYDHLNPFGPRFEVPLFLLKSLKISQIKQLRGGHLRLNLSEQPLQSVVGVWFYPAQDSELVRGSLGVGDQVDVLVELQWNYFASRKTLQLLIQDLRRSET